MFLISDWVNNLLNLFDILINVFIIPYLLTYFN